MSHSVTVTRTTTTSSATAIILNTGYVSTLPGLLTFIQTIVNSVCVGIVGYYFNKSYYYGTQDLFFLLIATTFLICTAVILLSCLLSLGTSSLLPKTMFHYLYHFTGFFLYLSAGVTLLIGLSDRSRYSVGYEAKMVAAILGLINAGLYLFSAILSYRTYTH